MWSFKEMGYPHNTKVPGEADHLEDLAGWWMKVTVLINRFPVWVKELRLEMPLETYSWREVILGFRISKPSRLACQGLRELVTNWRWYAFSISKFLGSWRMFLPTLAALCWWHSKDHFFTIWLTTYFIPSVANYCTCKKTNLSKYCSLLTRTLNTQNSDGD